LLSTSGVVPACRTLDCVSIFAANSSDASDVLAAAGAFDVKDAYSRSAGPGDGAAPWLGSAGPGLGGPFRFGVPPEEQLEFFGDDEAKKLYSAAIERVTRLGGEKVEIDFQVFRQAADLLYSGPWVAERTAALGEFLNTNAADMDPTVYKIISGGTKHGAVDCFKAQYKLEDLRRRATAEWARMDVLVLPTTGTTYTIEEVQKNPIQLNTNLGYYTNFVNLLDMAAVAVPAGFRPNKLPFGITIMGPAFSDEALLALAQRFYGTPGKTFATATGCVAVAVVGAHLSGEPLNWQLTQRAGRLAKATRTSAEYRLYALPGTVPPKPGMIRESGFAGPGIEVEVWNVPEDKFGGFVAGVPNPLSIGDVQLEDKSWVKCFLCEPAALAGAREITSFGGWRGYLAEGRSN
jgi:allophanate hydrolase